MTAARRRRRLMAWERMHRRNTAAGDTRTLVSSAHHNAFIRAVRDLRPVGVWPCTAYRYPWTLRWTPAERDVQTRRRR